MTQSKTNSSEWDAGYSAALMQLRERIAADHKKPAAPIKGVLEHIQDLLGRCKNCGGWVYGDGSCLTCALSQANGK